MSNKQTRGFGAPSRYFQGPGELEHLKHYTQLFGQRVFMLIDTVFFAKLTKDFVGQYSSPQEFLHTELFGGEITSEEIGRVGASARQFQAEVIVGIGGGKTIDTAKVVADGLHLPLIVVPTTASTDAPCSAMSIIYHPDGRHNYEKTYAKNPDLVLVDSKIIAQAPIRFLVAGMGDALSTYFEARANRLSGCLNYVNLGHGGGYKPTKAALGMAETCYQILLEDGLQAKRDAEAGRCSHALENVIEANTLLSGIGFENTGCAGAHALNYALAAVSKGLLHGEKVAFGVIVQLVMEQSPMEELKQVIGFCLDIGLAVTLEDLGIEAIPANVEKIATESIESMGPLWQSEPLFVDAEIVKKAIFAANALVQECKRMDHLTRP